MKFMPQKFLNGMLQTVMLSDCLPRSIQVMLIDDNDKAQRMMFRLNHLDVFSVNLIFLASTQIPRSVELVRIDTQCSD